MRISGATAAFAVALTSLLFIGSARAAERDHYLCYGTSPSFSAPAAVLPFSDGIQSPDRDYVAGKAKDLCLPVDKDGNPVGDASTVLTSYKIKLASEVPAQLKPVSTSDALLTTPQDFGVYTKKPEFVLVPAAKCASAPCLPPVTGSHDVDRYECYGAKLSRNYCAADAAQNPGKLCSSQADCGGSGCLSQPKFPKTLTTRLQSDFTPSKLFSLKKLKHFCTAVDVSHTGRLHANARLLCYQVKGIPRSCDPTSSMNVGGACQEDSDCGGTAGALTHCLAQARHVPQSVTVGDQFAASRGVTATKEDEVCIDACDEVSPYVSKLTSLQIGTDGNPGNGLDIDGNPLTCSPTGSCSAGIDNEFASLASLANPSLADALTNGTILLLLEFNGLNLTSGTHPTILNVFSGSLDPGNPACAIQTATCDYLIPNTCAAARFGANVTDGTALSGGGPGTDFTIDVPLGAALLPITIHNLQVQGTLSTSEGNVTGVTGVLGGAFVKQELLDTILSLPDGTILGLPSATVAGIVDGLLPTDVDLNDDMVNEATSLGLPFVGIPGAVTGMQP